jgi:hypothetical protein
MNLTPSLCRFLALWQIAIENTENYGEFALPWPDPSHWNFGVVLNGRVLTFSKVG